MRPTAAFRALEPRRPRCRLGVAIVAMCSAAVALAPPIAVGADPTEPDAYTILARVKAQWRTRQPPPYVAYTLVRHDTFNGEPDLADSYTLRIWCRTADNAALSRRVFGSRVRGNAEFIMPAFDKPIDPGPPTADLLAVMRSSEPTPTPSAPGSVPLIGSVASVIETTYDVSVVGSDATDVHLQLRARRDPDRNRLTDLYVDRRSYAIDRAVAHDHLYTAGQAIPQRFEIDFGAAADIPVIRSIHGQTDYAELDVRSGEPLYEVDYRFENIVFPSTLPPWYFEPARYGEHRAELPVE